MPDPKDPHEPVAPPDPAEPRESPGPAREDDAHGFLGLDPEGRVEVFGALKAGNAPDDRPTDAIETHEPTPAEPVDAEEAVEAAVDEPVDAIDALEHYHGEPDEPVEALETLEAIDVKPEGLVEALEEYYDEPIEAIEVHHPGHAPMSSQPSATKPSATRGILAGMAIGGLLVGIAGGVGYYLARPGASTVPGSDPPAALTARIDGMGKEIEAQSKGLKALKDKVDALPKPEPAPDLKPLEAKIDALAKRVDAVSAPDLKPLEAKIDALAKSHEEKIAGLEKALAAEKAEVDTLQAKVKSYAEARPRPDPAPATPPAASPTDAEFARAVDLYKKGQYDQARDAFARLQQAAANDARVWYYSALSNGLATGQWAGDTERFVQKGVEREQAGTPDVAKINAAFADLAPPAVKTWLDSWRARAR
jgi:tetratricopeptide (TPR) repeat protein